ncbi:MAG TPA: glutamate-5-semialdehyde dehydrogenase, partial [Thermoleophilia bacterium]|nr:glutamate-5-semialdehyde dehydrogenase [Thermoleophilia bacterium]
GAPGPLGAGHRGGRVTVEELCAAAKRAARSLATLPRERKDGALREVAEALERRADEILRENAEDLKLARTEHLPEVLVDRLLLDEDRLRDMAASVRAVMALEDPVGRVTRGWRLPNGLEVRKQRVPFGVVAVVYEARPNVTVDAAVLCLKTGNAVVLRGGRAAKHSNRILAEVVQGAVIEAGLPAEAVSYLPTERDMLLELLQQRGTVDLIIPRGGEDLKDFLLEHSRVPVIYAAGGNCHVYVDAAADLEKALRIVVNAKVQRPGVCNAAETLLVHTAVAGEFLPRAVKELGARGVELVVDKATADIVHDPSLKRANRTHYETEFLSLKLAVRVVDSVDEAVEHIATYGTGHSEAIVTEDLEAARRFTQLVDAACVYVNASTRFTDGGEFGLGAEIGISTQKLHARGPLALEELTCEKYVVWGEGQVRG